MNCHRDKATIKARTNRPCPTKVESVPEEGGEGFLLEPRAGLVQTQCGSRASHSKKLARLNPSAHHTRL